MKKKYLKFLIGIFERPLEVTLQKPIYWFSFISFFAGPDPPEWRGVGSVAYFKDKFYYLGGWDPKIDQDTNQIDVRRSNESQ